MKLRFLFLALLSLMKILFHVLTFSRCLGTKSTDVNSQGFRLAWEEDTTRQSIWRAEYFYVNRAEDKQGASTSFPPVRAAPISCSPLRSCWRSHTMSLLLTLLEPQTFRDQQNVYSIHGNKLEHMWYFVLKSQFIFIFKNPGKIQLTKFTLLAIFKSF